jgi:hypothetical protein
VIIVAFLWTLAVEQQAHHRKCTEQRQQPHCLGLPFTRKSPLGTSCMHAGQKLFNVQCSIAICHFAGSWLRDLAVLIDAVMILAGSIFS